MPITKPQPAAVPRRSMKKPRGKVERPTSRHCSLKPSLKNAVIPQRLFCSRGAGFVAVFTAFKNLLPHFLRGGLDFLHLFADARPCGLVSALCLAHILNGLINQSLEVFIFLHGR